jgi:hypothetical protein
MAFTIDRIFPTENDKGGDGVGQVFSEANLELLLTASRQNFVLNGLTLTLDSPSSGHVTVAAGQAVILGRYVDLSGTDSIDVDGGASPNGSDWYTIWLKLGRDGDSNVDTVSLVKRADDTIETDAVLLAEVRVGGGGSVSHGFRRGLGGPLVATGSFTTTPTSAPDASGNVRIGFRPRRVVLWTASNADLVEVWDGGPAIAHVGSGGCTINASGFAPTGNVDGTLAEYQAYF